jgi:PIN domain nuclease of toxin-antitoxin system
VTGRLKYLLDTHAFIWAATDDDRLSNRAVRIVTTTPCDQLAIADVTLQEIGLLLHSGRISFKGSPGMVLESLLNYLVVLPITLEIAIAAPELALPHGDHFDRIITATAKIHRLPLVTRDANISASSVISTVW